MSRGPLDGATFTVTKGTTKNPLGLDAAVLDPSGVTVDQGSVLDMSNYTDSAYKWDYLGILSVVYAWQHTADWQHFTTLKLNKAHLSSQSLGATPPPRPPPPGAQNLKDLFASSSFKVTTLEMEHLLFNSS